MNHLINKPTTKSHLGIYSLLIDLKNIYPNSFNSRKVHRTRESLVGHWWSVKTVMLMLCGAGELLPRRPITIVYVEKQCYDINNVNVKKDHDDHKVGPRTHTALLQLDTFTGHRGRLYG